MLLSRLPWPLKIILIVIIIVVARAARKKRTAKRALASGTPSVALNNPAPSQSYRPAGYPQPAAAAPPVAQQLAELKKRDPGFSEQHFEDTSSTAFFKVQQAWAGRNMSEASAFLSPALMQRFNAQIQDLYGITTELLALRRDRAHPAVNNCGFFN